jgi:hypothetical protein
MRGSLFMALLWGSLSVGVGYGQIVNPGGGGGGGGGGAYTSITGVPADTICGNNTGSTANLICSANPVATSLTLGNGTTAAWVQYTAGTAPSSAASNSVQFYAPASIATPYNVVLPGAAASGFERWTCVSVTCTESVSALSSGDVTTALGFTPAGLGANTFTGQQIISLNGAASTPPSLMTGTWYSGGSGATTKPQDLIECNSGTTASAGWSTAGTGLGANACAGFSGSLLDLQVNGSSVFLVTSAGGIAMSGGINSAGGLIAGTSVRVGAAAAFFWNGRSNILSPADGVIELTNNAGTGFTRLSLGGTTSTFGALGVTNQANPIILVRDATGGNTASLDAGQFVLVGGAAGTAAAGQITFGGTTAASTNCGGVATACIVINVAGTTRYLPYF